MSEWEALEVSLWTFSITSFVTVVVCAFLVWTMRGQRDRSSVGTLLRWHYVALGALSFVKGTLFAYYASRTGGSSEWLVEPARIGLLWSGSVFAAWLDVIGVLLVAAYFRARDAP